ncbi:uncharacterized protein LOC134203515 [Armigeres subalbatus]|uniref:uncharacterized protein LOC134203515 n=1 Tax=Armigeres subalbatus TaxID=124917 RepID=UPI002ED5B34A
MANFCCICGSKRHESPQKIILHSFPKDPDKLSAWLSVLAPDKIPENILAARVCSQHFSNHQYETTVYPNGNSFTRLARTACPDIIWSNVQENLRLCYRSVGVQTDVTFFAGSDIDCYTQGIAVTYGEENSKRSRDPIPLETPQDEPQKKRKSIECIESYVRDFRDKTSHSKCSDDDTYVTPNVEGVPLDELYSSVHLELCDVGSMEELDSGLDYC